MNAIDFANEVIDMQRHIEFLERELAHYKELYEMNCASLDRSDKHTREMVALTLKAALDPNSVINRGYAAIAAETQ